MAPPGMARPPFFRPRCPENSPDVIVLLEPVYLGPDVAVDDIALLVLETPWNNDQEIPLADPEPLLDLALDPPGARDTSSQRTRIWFAPSISSARPKISWFFFFGSLTRMISSLSFFPLPLGVVVSKSTP